MRGGVNMAFADLRDFLRFLEDAGELIRIEDEVDSRFEVSAVLKRVGQAGGPAVMFTGVKGYDVPVMGNLFGSLRRLAMALECEVAQINQVYLERREKPVGPTEVEGAPCRELVYRGAGLDLLSLLPILTYHEGDASPYITQGLVIVRDPESGAQSLGIHRIQVKGPRRIGIQLVSRTSMVYMERAEARGEGAEVAIAIGVDPCTLLASVAWVPFADKLALAGGMRRAPTEVTKGLATQLWLPARAEIVLEGRFIPGVRETEGPFGESTGYYITTESPVAEIELVSMRSGAIYAASEPWTREDEVLTAWSWAGEVLNSLRKEFPGVKAVKLSSMMANCVVSMTKSSPGEARRLIYRLLTSNPYFKYVTVVDDDVDLNNPMEVEWALTTRMLPDSGIIRLEGLEGSPIDPSVKLDPHLLTAKIGFDATRPWGHDEEFAKIDVPGSARQRATSLLAAAGWEA
ncbi:MAG: UbiD family decarboxylase [Clostridia bacterium]|nr:MAG: UbiD family decarboxylase [Clostridia bacterium]